MRKQISIDELIKNLEECNIAIHGIHNGSLEEKISIAKLIVGNGLNLSNNWKTILSSAVSMGNSGNINLEKDIKDYQYGYGEKCNVVIRVPSIITNSNGEKIYLGFPSYNKTTVAQQYSSTCVLDQVCSSFGKVPSEFIYGYYTGGNTIEVNPNYYDELPQKQKDALFINIKSSMSYFSKLISECVINGNKERLEELKHSFEERGVHEPAIDNALKELNDRTNSIDKRDSKEVDISPDISVVTKVSSFLSKLPVKRRLFGKEIDEKALLADNTILKDFYDALSIQDIQGIDNSNVNLMTKAFNLVNRLPASLKPDRLIEDKLKERLGTQQEKRRVILTDKHINDKAELSADFDKCVAAYLLNGGTDMFGRFHTLIRDMNKKGIHTNVGESILKLGNAFATKMEGLQNSSERNSKAWAFILPHILQVYTVSKNIGNELYNAEEHKKFEERLVNLGLIELEKENSTVNAKVKRKVDISSNSPYKSSSKQPVMLEHEQVKLAICQYINTGMLPNGYKLNDSGEIIKETQLDEMRRKAHQEYERKKTLEAERKERNRILIGVNGQPLPVQQKKRQEQRNQQVSNLQRIER